MKFLSYALKSSGAKLYLAFTVLLGVVPAIFFWHETKIWFWINVIIFLGVFVPGNIVAYRKYLKFQNKVQ